MNNEVVLPSEYENSPEWLLKSAVFHAANHAEEVLGISPEKHEKKYLSAVSKEATRFLDEYYQDSQGHSVRKNPTTPKDQNSFSTFDNLYFTGPESFVGKNVEGSAKQAKVRSLIRGAVNTLASIYLENAMHMKLHQGKLLGNSEPSSFSDMEFGGKKGTEEVKATHVARFQRAFVVSSILTMLAPLFETSGEDLKKLVEESLDNLKIADLKNISTRISFSDSVRSVIQKKGFSLANFKGALK